jgi:hypothetical protein
MIELAQTRYAAGKATANTMVFAAGSVCLAYALLLTGLLVHLICWRHLDWLDILALVSALLYYVYVGVGVGIFALLYLFDKQPVDPCAGAGALRKWWNSEPLLFARSLPVKLTLLVAGWLAVGRFWVVPVHSRPLYALYTIGVAGLVAWHGLALCRLAKYMRREATTLVDGKMDKKRGWDWDRFDSTDEGSFRDRFAAWKFPGDIAHPAEAEDYARKVRARRFFLMAFTAVAVVVIAALVSQPLAAEVMAMAHQFSDLTQPPRNPSTLEQLKFPGLILTLLIPVFMQYRTAEYPELAKLYDDRAKDLRTQKAQRRTLRRTRPETRRHLHCEIGVARLGLIRQSG